MKKIISLLMTASILLSFAGCKTEKTPTDAKEQEPTVQTEVQQPSENEQNVPAENLTDSIKDVKVTTNEIDSEFKKVGYDLYTKLFMKTLDEDKNENVLISPLSVHTALAMTANGAANSTKVEMEKLLAGNMDIEKLNGYFLGFLKSLSEDKTNKLSVANSVWYRDNENALTVIDKFLENCKGYYDAQVYKEPFNNSTVNNINNWVKEKTDGMIDSIVKDIDPEVMMYIINALAFDAEWENVYNKNSIRKGNFTDITGKKSSVDMMYSNENYYIESEDATGFIKNYKGGKYSFAAILPNEDSDIYSFAKTFNGQKLESILNSKRSTHVNAAMPKFSYEYEIKLNDILKNMGLKTAFDGQRADFSDMAISSMGNLYIGEVMHKTFITVDEKGTKAGAVTSVAMNAESAPAEIKTVHLDRPFIYMIIDNDTNLPVFMGALTSIK